MIIVVVVVEKKFFSFASCLLARLTVIATNTNTNTDINTATDADAGRQPTPFKTVKTAMTQHHINTCKLVSMMMQYACKMVQYCAISCVYRQTDRQFPVERFNIPFIPSPLFVVLTYFVYLSGCLHLFSCLVVQLAFNWIHIGCTECITTTSTLK